MVAASVNAAAIASAEANLAAMAKSVVDSDNLVPRCGSSSPIDFIVSSNLLTSSEACSTTAKSGVSIYGKTNTKPARSALLLTLIQEDHGFDER